MVIGKLKWKWRNIFVIFLALSLLCNFIPSKAVTYKEGFRYQPLTSVQQKTMLGVSYPEKGAKLPMTSLRSVQVKYIDFKGKTKTGTLIVHKKIARKTVQIFYELYKMKYPLQRIEVVDRYEADDTKSMAANNTSAFNYRLIAGTNKLSNHGKGLAIDINPRINPCVKKGKVEPANGKVYKNRNVKTCKGKYAKYMIHKNDKVYKIGRAHV